MSEALAARPPVWADQPPFTPILAPRGWRRVPRLASRIGTFALVEVRKLRHDQTEILTRAIQPVLWMVIFGTTFARLHTLPTGSVPYLDFLAPGIIAQSALFIAIFYGIQIIWDRDAGILTKLLVTPTPRAALITGKCFAAGIRAVAQIVVIVIVALLMGVGLTDNPLRILATVPAVFLGTAFFACLSMTIAGLVQARDRLMGIGQAITMPLFFASNALYPTDLMPGWLQAVSKVNPLSYEVEALRGLLIGTPANLWLDFGVLIGAAALSVATAAALLGRLVR
ncbi:ABC transporter permease [Nocardia sp. NPDC056000]|uniref:ABC transporter permease n=1 Tax=Nocardia sp. NPDC056000 TaxID=3345674 RepID=UPI0035DEACD4